ncbi:4a-hydroxytetrahydrobiopterin dehydratase [Actinocorallia longicatena]|uniref:Putative pterin-4-alpha-carbinolamine dehydratase n=1 Tax=Actinocorallia longicatena TaxID=111803 RepID=A0ABP6PZD7_9ACTN
MDGWTETGNALIQEWVFKDFAEAMIFVNKVAAVAEEANHHPDFHIVWNRVTLTLSTHDAGGLTEKDFALAERLNTV